MDTDRMKDKGEELKGRAKQAVGDATGDERMKRDGQVDEASGKTKQGIDKVREKTSDMVDKVKDKVKE